jgi:hypothetical protein
VEKDDMGTMTTPPASTETRSAQPLSVAVLLLVATVGVGAAACGLPDLGLAPFYCNNGQPLCPEGYSCDKPSNTCVREGQSSPVSDAKGGKKDGGTKKDGAKDGRKTEAGSSSLHLHITEFLADPQATNDSEGEWFELFNPDTVAVDINGWTIKDNGTDSHKIASTGTLTVPAKGFLVLGASTDKVKNGGVNVAYSWNSNSDAGYGNFYLSNTQDEIILVDDTGKTVDSVSYSKSAGWSITTGASLSLKNWGLNKSLTTSWCVETQAWAGSKGDKGTPGAVVYCK